MSEISWYSYVRRRKIRYEKNIFNCSETLGRLIVALVDAADFLRVNKTPLRQHVEDMTQFMYDDKLSAKRLEYVRDVIRRKHDFLLHFIQQHEITKRTWKGC